MHGITRRAFLRDLGQGTLAVAVLGVGAVACSSGDDAVTPTTDGTSTSTTGATSTSTSTATSVPLPPPDGGGEAATWERVNLRNVSAYILVRRGEAALVDTGNPGNAGDIQATLEDLGLAWDDVSHVILTHLHRDHVGSLGDVLEAATAAGGFAGEPDIPSIPSPRTLTPVGDGDTVFGLDIIATPGHTPGSISVLDRAAGLLVAGDALQGADGGVIGANPQFTADVVMADDSIRKLATYPFDTVVFGHGEPVIGGASQQVAAFAASI